MTRIPDSSLIKGVLSDLRDTRGLVAQYTDEVSSGIRVRDPGDTNIAGTVSQFRESISRIDGYRNRIETVRSQITFQDDIMAQVTELITRAKELATQAANGTNSTTSREQTSQEILQIRNQLVAFGNSTYQGRYIFGGADDDDPPYERIGSPGYTTPGTGEVSDRYRFDGEAGTSLTRSVQVTDDVSITVNTPGSSIFDTALYALERLGRSLAGYKTDTSGAQGQPVGTGAAYSFPAEFATQTLDIQATIDQLQSGIDNEIQPERVSLGARLSRLDLAKQVLDTTKSNSQAVLTEIQDSDQIDAVSKLTQAQTSLEAIFQVTAQTLRRSILDYL